MSPTQIRTAILAGQNITEPAEQAAFVAGYLLGTLHRILEAESLERVQYNVELTRRILTGNLQDAEASAQSAVDESHDAARANAREAL